MYNTLLYRGIIHTTLQSKKKFSLPYSGNDMYPVLYDGDILSYKSIHFKKVKRNDIAVVKHGNKMLAHRVVFRTNRYLITKGDNNYERDPYSYDRNFVGIVYEIQRQGSVFYPDVIYLIQSTVYATEINSIIHALNKNNIQYVFLKGVFLYLIYQKKPPRRKYSDFDILVKSKDAMHVKELLRQLGYGPKTVLPDSTSAHFTVTGEDTYEKRTAPFPTVIDVHYEALFTMKLLPNVHELYSHKLIEKLTDECMENAREMPVAGTVCGILSPHHLLLYLGLHFFHHNYKGIYRLELLDSVMRVYLSRGKSQVLERLTEKIGEYHMENYMYGVFVLLKKYFKTPIPPSFMKKIHPSSGVRKYVEYSISDNAVFTGYDRINEELYVFRNLFVLSPRPFALRMLVFLRPPIIKMLFLLVKSYVVNTVYYSVSGKRKQVRI